MKYLVSMVCSYLVSASLFAQTPVLQMDGKAVAQVTDETPLELDKELSLHVEFDKFDLGGGIFLVRKGTETKLREFRQVSAGSVIAATMVDLTLDGKPELVLEVTSGSLKSLLIYEILDNDYQFLDVVYAKKPTIAALPEAMVAEAKFYIEKNKLYLELMNSTSTITWDKKLSKLVYHLNKKLK